VLALGEIGLTVDYFYSLTPRLFSNIVDGYVKRENRQNQRSWEQTRLLFFSVLKPYLKEKSVTAEKLLPFEWDKIKVNDTADFNPDEVAEIIRKQKEFWAKADKTRKANGKFSGN